MRPLWRLAIRNWWASPGRTFATILSVAVGVATVATITGAYETARRVVQRDVVAQWFGSAQVTIHPIGAHWGTIDLSRMPTFDTVDNVEHVSARLKRHALLKGVAAPPAGVWHAAIDAIGIDPADSGVFQSWPGLMGRLLVPGDHGVALLERQTAEQYGVSLLDGVDIVMPKGSAVARVQVVGLFEGRRIGGFQRPYLYLPLADLQTLTGESNAATAVDIALHDTSRRAIERTQAAIESMLAARGLAYQYKVDTSSGRQILFDEADRVIRLTLLITAFVTMLTAFFIILTTMGMSLYERRATLGMLRCIGLTRMQLATLVLLELLPLGVVGTGLGILGAWGTMTLGAHLATHMNIEATLDGWGVRLAIASGLLTTLVSTLLLIVQVARLQPLAAVHTQAQPARTWWAYAAGAVGLLLLITHELFVAAPDHSRWLTPLFAGMGTASLYLGYILLTPAAVVMLGRPLARLVGPLLGLTGRLCENQFGKTPWRSTGVCWMLVVGVSLIIYIAIASESVLSIWRFPSRLPECFVWTKEYAPGEVIPSVQALPGVGEMTLVADVDCTIETPDAKVSLGDGLLAALMSKVLRPVFVGSDPGQLMDMVQVKFDEGTREDALRKLRRGGYVLIPTQTARNKGLHLGDRMRIGIKDRTADFEVAGVVQAPILDLVVTAFQATSYMQFAAASVVIGTRDDLIDKFDLDVVSMVLFDLNMPSTPAPAAFLQEQPPNMAGARRAGELMLDWSDALPNSADELSPFRREWDRWRDAGYSAPVPQTVVAATKRFRTALRWTRWYWHRVDPEKRWAIFRERLLLHRVAETMDRPDAITGSMLRLRYFADLALRRGFKIVTFLPTLVLAIAAIGVGNLMMVSIQIRAKEIAILRAVGAIKSQIIRLVLVEAISLALIGGLCGVALGAHAAVSDNRITGNLIGFRPDIVVPYGTILVGMALTVVVCLLAGLVPARRAARGNVVAALQAS